MGKRHPNQPAWQWRVAPNTAADGTREGMHLLSVILFALAFLTLASAVFTEEPATFAIAVIGLIAAYGIRHKGHTLEA